MNAQRPLEKPFKNSIKQNDVDTRIKRKGFAIRRIFRIEKIFDMNKTLLSSLS